jgi:GcrA cell cycle regulator
VINEWTDVMKRRFAKLHRQTPELSFTTIASMMSAEFGIELTRNACIGKARRMGLAMRGKRGDSRRIPDQKKARPMTIKIDAPILPPPTELPAAPDGLTIYQLNGNTCRWPSGAYPPYSYCGCRTRAGLPYCAAHARRAYNAPAKQWS